MGFVTLEGPSPDGVTDSTATRGKRHPVDGGAGERHELHARAGRDTRIAEIAGRQYGVISRSQLRAAGLSARGIEERVVRGRLHAVHRGVYALGHLALPPLSREAAALLAIGGSVALSHRTAGALWGISGDDGPVDVTVAGRHRHRPGIRVHSTGSLAAGACVVHQGMRTTAPARTLLDLAGVMPPAALARAVEEAQVQRLVTPTDLRAELERHPRRRGSAALRRLLGSLETPSLTRSEAERRLLDLIRAAGLPHPRTNVRLHGYEVDVHWPERRLVVEVDGYAFHGTREAFERDRRRDARLQAAGERVIRLTWRRIVGEPEAVVALLAVALAP